MPKGERESFPFRHVSCCPLALCAVPHSTFSRMSGEQFFRIQHPRNGRELCHSQLEERYLVLWSLQLENFQHSQQTLFFRWSVSVKLCRESILLAIICSSTCKCIWCKRPFNRKSRKPSPPPFLAEANAAVPCLTCAYFGVLISRMGENSLAQPPPRC